MLGLRDLSDKEQLAVRVALRFLRRRLGTWQRLAKVLHYKSDSVHKVASGRRAVTPQMVVRVAKLTNIKIDTLLAGEWLSRRVCPFCGHPPIDFEDEATMVDRDLR